MRNMNVAVALAVAGLALAGCSDDEQASTTPAASGNGVCLQSTDIDHTAILDNKTIIFYMKNGHPWKNSLHFDCPSLQIEDGFAYESDFSEICSNAQTIRVLRSGNFCELGQFTPYQAPPKP